MADIEAQVSEKNQKYTAPFNPFRYYYWVDAVLLFVMSGLLVGLDELLKLQLSTKLYGIIIGICIVFLVYGRQCLFPKKNLPLDDKRSSLIAMLFVFLMAAGIFFSFFGFHTLRMALTLNVEPVEEQSVQSRARSQLQSNILLEQVKAIGSAVPITEDDQKDVKVITAEELQAQIKEDQEKQFNTIKTQVADELAHEHQADYSDKVSRLSKSASVMVLMGFILLMLSAMSEKLNTLLLKRVRMNSK